MKRKHILLSISNVKIHHNILTNSEWDEAHKMSKFEGVPFSQYVAKLILNDINKRGFLLEEK